MALPHKIKKSGSELNGRCFAPRSVCHFSTALAGCVWLAITRISCAGQIGRNENYVAAPAHLSYQEPHDTLTSWATFPLCATKQNLTSKNLTCNAVNLVRRFQLFPRHLFQCLAFVMLPSLIPILALFLFEVFPALFRRHHFPILCVVQ